MDTSSNRPVVVRPDKTRGKNGVTVYRWNDRQDVDEAVVVVMNTLDAGEDIPGWLMRTLQQAINDSDPQLSQYFFTELEQHRPEALEYFRKPEF